MQRTLTCNMQCKKIIETQSQIIKQCCNRIIELETHIMKFDPKPNITRSVIKELFPDAPPIINLQKIEKITDKYFLIQLEEKYDKFLQKNEQLLLMHDIIEDLLDIRDEILLQIGRLNRQERMSLWKL
jgi:hypothetical protein